MVVSAISVVTDSTKWAQLDEKTADPEKEPSFKPQTFLLAMLGMYAVPLLLVLICAMTTVISLLLPSTGAWFRLASQARREHRQMLKSLGD